MGRIGLLIGAASALILCASCSRATLPLGPSGETSPGAGGSGAGGGATGGGGEGGEPPAGWPCPLTVEPTIGVAGGGSFHQRQPLLSFSRDDKSRVTVAMEWIQSEGPMTPPSELRHVSFSPWGAWPSGEIGLSFRASFDAGASFAIAPAFNDQFALFMSDGGKPSDPDGIAVAPVVTPENGDVPASLQVDDGNTVLFASRRSDKYLLGVAGADAATPARVRTITTIGGTVAIGTAWPVACGEGLSARAVSVSPGTGWLLAAAIAPDTFGLADCSDFEQLSPSELVIARVDSELGVPSFAAGFTPTELVRAIAWAKADGEAPWLVWLGPSTLGVVRIDARGLLDSVMLTIPVTGLEYRLATAPFRDGVLVFFTSAGSTSVVFVAETGVPSVTLSPPELANLEAVDALPSPDGKSVLLSGVRPGGGSEDRIRLARLQCAAE